jgi:multiple sugar transport system ATP-binding protein
MAQVELEKISKVYPPAIQAVDGLDLSIADREFVVLVGPSGCGKSTTLRMVAGLEAITSGIIKIGGRVVNEVPPKDRDIAMVFQNYALYPHMTVYKNMAFGLKLRRMPKAQIHQRVTDAAKILDIEHLLDRKPKALSGGQRQRVAVGRAIVREPAAFLFDEPLSNLDAKLRVTTRAELKRLHQRLKTTTIYVTHDQEEAMTLGDRIVAMKDGKIQQADTPLNTYNFPANRFVAGFIGMPPMNFFEGIVRSVDGGLIFEESAQGRGFDLRIPGHLQEQMGAHLGRQVVLGIRPEHFHLHPLAAGNGCEIRVKLNVVEPLGNDMDVYAQTVFGNNIVARVEARSGLAPDQQIILYGDAQRIHFFEMGETGVNLANRYRSTELAAEAASPSA